MSQHLNIVVSSQVYIWYFSKEFRHESYKVDERLARFGTENTEPVFIQILPVCQSSWCMYKMPTGLKKPLSMT